MGRGNLRHRMAASAVVLSICSTRNTCAFFEFFGLTYTAPTPAFMSALLCSPLFRPVLPIGGVRRAGGNGYEDTCKIQVRSLNSLICCSRIPALPSRGMHSAVECPPWPSSAGTTRILSALFAFFELTNTALNSATTPIFFPTSRLGALSEVGTIRAPFLTTALFSLRPLDCCLLSRFESEAKRFDSCTFTGIRLRTRSHSLVTTATQDTRTILVRSLNSLLFCSLSCSRPYAK